MRWPRAPADLLTDKTFFVIHADLQSLSEKKSIDEELVGQSFAAGLNECADPVDAWPPIMRKKRARQRPCEAADQREEPRPATAVLDQPLVLDPQFIDKLDMSLISKESLSSSLVRVSLDKPSVRHIDNPRGRIEEVVARPGSDCCLDGQSAKPRTKILSPTLRLAGRRKPTTELTSSPPPVTSARRVESNDAQLSPRARRTDDNNNKNKQLQQQQQQQPPQLSPLRLKTYQSTPGNNSFIAQRIRKLNPELSAPEACLSCVRTSQPERLHSHPRSPSSLSPAKEAPPTLVPCRSSVSIIPVRMSGKTVRKPGTKPELQLYAGKKGTERKSGPQSPATTTPRSDTNSGSMASPKTPTIDSNKLGDEDVKREKKGSAITSPKSAEEKSMAGAMKRRPRSVTCYICGREFGTMSFPIHEPKCLEKWHRENKALPVAQRRNEPQRPNVPLDSEEWNNVAWEQSQALLVPCSKCKRTFLPDRLPIHERNCRNSSKQ